VKWRDQPPEWRLAAILAIGLVSWALVMGVSAHATFHARPHDPLGPVLGLELARDVKEVHAILTWGDACANVSALKLHLVLDLGFMALYGPLLVALGLLAGAAGRWWRRVLVGLAAATVVADAAENLGLWEIATTITWETASRTVHARSCVKWALFYATVACVTLLWHRRAALAPKVRTLAVIAGAAVVLLGAIGFAWPRAIGWSFAPMAVFLPVAILGSRRSPEPPASG
jgi:hypothetical protein